jgi:hypothetical protein
MTTPDTPTTTPPAPAPVKPMPLGWAVTAAAVCILVIGGIILLVTVHTKPQPVKACEAWVSDQLSAPATASFSNEQWFDGDNPEVFGDVDSENGFGAMLRTHFVCSMQRQDGTWVVVDGSAL